MTTPERTSNHRTSSIVVATAAVTVALGVTVASLAGYLGPRTPPPQQASAPVVLVPVTSEPAVAPVVAAEPEPMFADFVTPREHEREERHHHRERHHDDD